MLEQCHVSNFNTLVHAVANDRFVYLECIDQTSRETVAVICAVRKLVDGNVVFEPYALLIDGEQQTMILPPDPSCGDFGEEALPCEPS